MVALTIVAIASGGPLDGTHEYSFGDEFTVDNLASLISVFENIKVGSKLRSCSPHAVETMQTLGLDEMLEQNKTMERNNEYTVTSIEIKDNTRIVHLTYRLLSLS
jgi:hypothetical protein